MCTPSDANRDGMGSRAPIARLHSLPRALTGEVISNENQQDDCVPVFEPRLFGTAIPAFGVVAFAAPRMASFLDTLCDSSSASVAASCHFHSCMRIAAWAQLHAHSRMRTAACAQPHAHSRMGTAAYTAECAQLHAHSCMRTAACAQQHARSPFNTQDAVETWIGIPVILVEP